MAYIIKCLNLVLNYKGNKCKEYKWILAFLKLKRLIKNNSKKIKKKGVEWDCL